jgi:L-ribulose-5-phosphate 4-epimerase
MYEKEKEELIKTAGKLISCGLIKLTTGNLSVRNGEHVIISPSGMDKSELEVNDIVVIDLKGNVVEGIRKPSKESDGNLYIYNNMPDVKAIIHTHQVYATAVSLVGDTLPAILTTQASAVGGEVKVTPYAPAGSKQIGIYAVEYFGGNKAVILKHHGVYAIGNNLNDALHTAVYLEEASQTYLAARAICVPPVLADWQIQKAHDIYKGYLVER